jgi:hypothetical protein
LRYETLSPTPASRHWLKTLFPANTCLNPAFAVRAGYTCLRITEWTLTISVQTWRTRAGAPQDLNYQPIHDVKEPNDDTRGQRPYAFRN